MGKSFDTGDFVDEVKAWFGKGLKFKCTGCGNCCTGKDGYVFLSTYDIEQLAIHFQISPEQFISQYTRLQDGEKVLLNEPNSDCTFLKENRCSVYHHRPIQCRTFPWWLENIRSEKAWNEAAKHCEGINHSDAELVSTRQIEEECGTYLDNLLEKNFTCK